MDIRVALVAVAVVTGCLSGSEGSLSAAAGSPAVAAPAAPTLLDTSVVGWSAAAMQSIRVLSSAGATGKLFVQLCIVPSALLYR